MVALCNKWCVESLKTGCQVIPSPPHSAQISAVNMARNCNKGHSPGSGDQSDNTCVFGPLLVSRN